WRIRGNRLYQNDSGAGLAKVNIRVPQRGIVRYEFNVRLEGGAEDLHGGFGLHIFADSVYPRASWGTDKSYLLWLNYDANPVSKDIPRGLSAQVYKSRSHSYMELVSSVDLNDYAYLLEEISSDTVVPVRVIVNGNTGTVRIMDPFDRETYYSFSLGTRGRLEGDWVALRTNGIAASFGYMD
ncbi:MAG: hypothetical protein ACLFRY_15745, partial [Spirochaetia bacterium]